MKIKNSPQRKKYRRKNKRSSTKKKLLTKGGSPFLGKLNNFGRRLKRSITPRSKEMKRKQLQRQMKNAQLAQKDLNMRKAREAAENARFLAEQKKIEDLERKSYENTQPKPTRQSRRKKINVNPNFVSFDTPDIIPRNEIQTPPRSESYGNTSSRSRRSEPRRNLNKRPNIEKLIAASGSSLRSDEGGDDEYFLRNLLQKRRN